MIAWTAAALAAVAFVMLPGAGAGFGADQNPVIVSPQSTDALYEGYTGPFVVDFSNAPPTRTTYNYAVFSDDGPTTLVAGPYQYVWEGVGANPHLMVKPLKADAHLRFKITDGAGHAAELPFVVRPGSAPRCALVVQSKVRVHAQVEKIPGRLNSTCASLGTTSADWKVTYGGQVLDYFRFTTNTTDTWSVYDTDPTGTYRILPLSARAGTTDVPQNSPTAVVKRASWLSLTATRSGSFTTLSVVAARYVADRHTFLGWSGGRVTISYTTCNGCIARELPPLTLDHSGRATYRFQVKSQQRYGASISGTSAVWGASDTVTR